MTSEGLGINPVLFNSQLGEGRKTYERDKWKEESNTEEKVDCSCPGRRARGAWRAVISSFRLNRWETGAEGEKEQTREDGARELCTVLLTNLPSVRKTLWVVERALCREFPGN